MKSLSNQTIWINLFANLDIFRHEVRGICLLPSDSVVKNPPAKQETQVQSLDQEDALEKEMATHSSFPA